MSDTRTIAWDWTHRTLAILALCFVAMPCANAQVVQLSFAGRTWNIKASNSPVGPGPNRFSASPNDVWVDQAGLHLTIHKNGALWYSSEVILRENLGYGTYLFQTTSRQDILNANAVFGAFTWDTLANNDYYREIDFEDSRWKNPSDPTNSQAVVQPTDTEAQRLTHLQRITIPDLSQDAALTRYFTWSPNQVEFTSARGHHLPNDVPVEAVFHHWDYVANGTSRLVPAPGLENFRFNLWLFQGTPPVGDQPVEVVINDFVFIPLLAGDYDGNGTVGPEDYNQWKTSFGQQIVRFSGADGSGNGSVGTEDYVVWRDNLGGTMGAGSNAMAHAAPEPCSTVLVICAAALVAVCRRCHLTLRP